METLSVAKRVYCLCACGAWWYAPPADPRAVFLPEHRNRRKLWINANGEPRECAWCEGVFTVTGGGGKRGARPIYCSAECRKEARKYGKREESD
jgi:hypothetical protein